MALPSVFCVMFCRSLFVLFLMAIVLSVFDLRLLITPLLVSSNSFYKSLGGSKQKGPKLDTKNRLRFTLDVLWGSYCSIISFLWSVLLIIAWSVCPITFCYFYCLFFFVSYVLYLNLFQLCLREIVLSVNTIV